MSTRKMSNPKDVQYKQISEEQESPVHTPTTRLVVGAVLFLGVCGLIGLTTLVIYKIVNAAHVPTPLESLTNGFVNQPLKRVLQDVKTDGSGTIPDWLTGDFYYNGPAFYTVPTEHWFFGLAQINRFSISAADNAVQFTSQFVHSDDYNHALQLAEAQQAFGARPLAGVAKAIIEDAAAAAAPAGALPSPNTDVTLWRLDGHYLSNTASQWSNEFDPITLNTLSAPFNFLGNLPLTDVAAEHAHFDLQGNFVHFGAQLSIPQPLYDIYSVAPDSITRNMAGAGVKPNQPKPVYMHSFSLTAKYVILTENPVPFPAGDPFDFTKFVFEESWGTIFTVVDRVTGAQAMTFTADPFFCFHHVNAYEVPENNTIIIDLVRFPNINVIKTLYLNNILNATTNPNTVAAWSAARLYRYTLNTAAPGSKATSRMLADVPLELPQINHAVYNTKPYRYTWAVSVKDQNSVFNDRIVKIDTLTGQYTEWYHSHKVFVGEPQFVPNPKGTAEDDGVLLSVVLDGRVNNTFLLILDAGDLSETARATVSDNVVPLGFHGRYYPKK